MCVKTQEIHVRVCRTGRDRVPIRAHRRRVETRRPTRDDVSHLHVLHVHPRTLFGCSLPSFVGEKCTCSPSTHDDLQLLYRDRHTRVKFKYNACVMCHRDGKF